MECIYRPNRKINDKLPKLVVLLSGGMDSTVCAALAKSQGYQVIGLSIVYGQKHQIELKAAQAVAQSLEVPLYLLNLPPNTITGSALTDQDKEIPINRSLEEIQSSGVVSSYVPARNLILISLAASFAEANEAEFIYYGAHREDRIGYPDCRPEFLKAMGLAVMLGTAKKIQLEAPFINYSKSEIVKVANQLKAPLELTYSCYQGQQPACGVCDTCLGRINAFKQAGLKDPIEYAVNIEWGNP